MKEISEADFFRRWELQDAEWHAIADQMCSSAPGRTITACDVSAEQRSRALANGSTFVLCSADGKYYEATPAEMAKFARLA